MKYKIDTSAKEVVEVYGTPKKDIKGIKVGQELWIIARHIWGERSRYVRYANVTSFPTDSIKIRFITNDQIENNRRAKLLIDVWKYAYKNIPVTVNLFPERKNDKKINEDYDSIITEAATLYKQYHKKNIRESTSGLRMLNRALNQEPSTKLLSKPRQKDSVEKVISKLLIEDVSVINKITDILTDTLYVDERGDIKTIGGKEKANKSIRKIIKKEFLKRYKITK